MKIAVFGAEGQLGCEFVRHFVSCHVPVVGVGRKDCNIIDPEIVEKVLARENPDVVINTAAFNQVDQAEDDPAVALAVNAEAPRMLAEKCSLRKIRMVHFGTDYVFDGQKGAPYIESDPARPLSVYGSSKLSGERNVLTTSPDHLVFRVSWVTGSGQQNFLFKLREWMARQDVVRVADDEVSVPTFAFRIVRVVHQALQKGLGGLFHLTNAGTASRYDWAREYLRLSGFSVDKVVPAKRAAFALRASRPGYSVMSSQALCEGLSITIPDWREDLKRYVEGRLGEKEML